MTYEQAVSHINSYINFEKIPKFNCAAYFKLGRMQAFLSDLGDPHSGVEVIHIAGSKGKGSTCAIIANILKEAGYCVGLYTSPHLLDFRERIRVVSKHEGRGTANVADFLEGMISEREFTELVERIEPIADRFKAFDDLGGITFFEFLTGMAFKYFKDKNVDVIILETGLGGRLDATNITDAIGYGITNISLEHTDKLGNTLAAIAYEKAGIIKSGCKGVLTASQDKEAGDVIRKACLEKNVKLYEVGRDVTYSISESTINKQIFNLAGPEYSFEGLELSLIGRHQVENASLSIGLLKLLNGVLIDINESSIRKGLKSVYWPGRLQIIRNNPYVIADGAHNMESINNLIASIKDLFKYRKLITIFGISSDKDIRNISRRLDEFSNEVILTKADDNPRAVDPVSLIDNFNHSGKNVKMAKGVQEALDIALDIADASDLILVTGSLFLVGDALRIKVTNGY